MSIVSLTLGLIHFHIYRFVPNRHSSLNSINNSIDYDYLHGRKVLITTNDPALSTSLSLSLSILVFRVDFQLTHTIGLFHRQSHSSIEMHF